MRKNQSNNTANRTNRVGANQKRPVRVIILRPGERVLVVSPRRKKHRRPNNTTM